MMFIKMLEPATASIAVYLLAKTPNHISTLNKNKILLRKPMYLKSKVCKWLYENKHDLLDTVIEESNDAMVDVINQIYVIKFINPSLFLSLYVFILIMTIILM